MGSSTKAGACPVARPSAKLNGATRLKLGFSRAPAPGSIMRQPAAATSRFQWPASAPGGGEPGRPRFGLSGDRGSAPVAGPGSHRGVIALAAWPAARWGIPAGSCASWRRDLPGWPQCSPPQGHELPLWPISHAEPERLISTRVRASSACRNPARAASRHGKDDGRPLSLGRQLGITD